MKVSKLRLKNIKCFKEVEIPFEDENGNIKDCNLIVGDNGSGKTTVLRSLALGLCDQEGVSALLADIPGNGFLRRDENEGSIELFLKDTVGNQEYKIETKIKLSKDKEREVVSQKFDEKLKRKELFTVAYGSGRSIIGTDSYEEYSMVDSMYNLFKYESRLHNAELSASRIQLHTEKWPMVQKILKNILMLDNNDKIFLEINGLFISSNKWGKISFNELSDGYQSLTSVILDFLCWKLLNIGKKDFDLNNLSGIFIIDEVEQHLHPQWQRNIIKILSQQFPNVQFIYSTHTPICALGLTDLDCLSQVIKIGYINGHSNKKIFNIKEDFKGYRVDQILTSEVFGLSDTRSLTIEKKLKKYRDIYIKEEGDRSEQEKKDLKEIEDELKDLPMWEDEEDRKIRERLIKLEEEARNKTK